MDILAGIMISIGCLLYLQIGGVAGACLFAVGLGSICFFKMKLFTGQAGKLITKEIGAWELGQVWFGNLLGVIIMIGITLLHPNYAAINAGAEAILNSRITADIDLMFGQSFFLAIPCGILMYCAVSAQDTLQLVYIVMCVAAFILCGFYHCVADMYYTFLAAKQWQSYINLIFVTFGNVVGCNLVPFFKRYI